MVLVKSCANCGRALSVANEGWSQRPEALSVARSFAARRALPMRNSRSRRSAGVPRWRGARGGQWRNVVCERVQGMCDGADAGRVRLPPDALCKCRKYRLFATVCSCCKHGLAALRYTQFGSADKSC